MADESVEWDLRGHALLAKLERDGVDAGRLSLTRECLSAYADVGVMREGRAVRLDCECPCSDGCWAGLGADERPDDQHAGVSAPFIGPDYEQYRIVLEGVSIPGGRVVEAGVELWGRVT